MARPPRTIPYARQSVDDSDVDAVIRVLRGDWLTQGPAIDAFEAEVARRCGARYAVAVSNGTAALHLACLALGMAPGRSLWTSPNTFVASANCARYCGAGVGFVDIDARSLNLDPAALEEKLSQAERAGSLPAALVPVHFGGQPCDMPAIGRLARRHGIAVIEDASHALGASFAGEPTGACAHSDITVLSFHPVKIITSAEGGMALTNREDLYRALLRLRTHGITRDPGQMEGTPDGPWYYEQGELGYNYRITDLQAALGLSQMARLDAFLARRAALAARYEELLQGLPLRTQWQHPRARSAWHLYPVCLDEALWPRHREIFEALRARGILVNLHYIPVHLQPYYRRLGFSPGDFPRAEAYYRGALSLPMYADLTDDAQDEVVDALRSILGAQG